MGEQPERKLLYFAIMLVPSVQKLLHLRGALAVNAVRNCSGFYSKASVATLTGNSDGQYSRIPYNPNDISFYEHKVNGKLVGKPAVSTGTGWTALSPNGIKYGHYGKRYQEKVWQRVMYECELLMYFGFIVLAIVWKIQGLFVVNKWNNIHPVPQGIYVKTQIIISLV